jgi:hypothetical protein
MTHDSMRTCPPISTMTQYITSPIRLAVRSTIAAMLIWAGPASAADPSKKEVRAHAAYVNKAGVADWLIPDYVVKFRVPKGAKWGIYFKTRRANTAFNFRGPSASTQVVGDSTEITIVAGGRARHAAGYGRRNAWEFANELRVRYRI